MAERDRLPSIRDWPPQWFEPLSTRPSRHIIYNDIYFSASGLEFMSAFSDFAQPGCADWRSIAFALVGSRKTLRVDFPPEDLPPDKNSREDEQTREA